MGIQIKGLDKLYRKLRDLERRDAATILRSAVTTGTAVLAAANKAATPVGSSGELQRAQTSKVTGRGLTVIGIIGASVAALRRYAADGKGHPTNVDWLAEFGHV